MAVRKGSTKKTVATRTAAKADGRGNDLVDRYLAEQPPDKRALLTKLRALIQKAVPDASVSIKWGVPVYQRNGRNICALAAFREHVAINFFARPEVLVDPADRLEGGKTSRALKVRGAGDIDSASILRWLKATAAANG